jgi:hypothetical protein
LVFTIIADEREREIAGPSGFISSSIRVRKLLLAILVWTAKTSSFSFKSAWLLGKDPFIQAEHPDNHDAYKWEHDEYGIHNRITHTAPPPLIAVWC